MDVECASREFSINSFATETGRWITSPAAIKSITFLDSCCILGGGCGGCCVGGCGGDGGCGVLVGGGGGVEVAIWKDCVGTIERWNQDHDTSSLFTLFAK